MHTISRRARPHTITVYNYVATTAGVAAYQRTVVERVHLDRAYQQRLSQRGVTTADTALLMIDLSDIKTTSNRKFIDAESWPALSAAQQALYFTFRAPHDFFVEGTAPEALPAATKATMQAKYRCLAVSNVAIPASDTAGPRILEVTAQ